MSRKRRLHKREALRKQKQHNDRLRKDKVRRAANLAKQKDLELARIAKTEKENEELKEQEKKDKTFFRRLNKACKRVKWWITEIIWIRILNIFRKLFKRNA